jgi:hypothetical protein
VELAQAHVADLYPEVVYGKPPLMMLPKGTILGTWAYSIPHKMRWIINRDMEIAPGVMPGDVARSWVRDLFTLPLRRRKTQLAKGYPSPIHARRGKWGICSYVDIVKAYARILHFGYDVEYELGRYLGSEVRNVPPEIATNKAVYSLAVTMSNSARSNLEVMGQDGVFDRHPLNNFSNPCLFNLARETLNGIGSEILAVMGDECVYANADGFIIREPYSKYAIEIINSWGFEARIKEKDGVLLTGETEIFGVSNYKIAGYRTRRNDENAQDFTGPLMERDHRRWLKTEYHHWRDDLEGVANA